MNKKDWSVNFGEKLNDLMQERGYTVTTLARDVGVSRAALYSYISGAKIPSAIVATNLAYILGTSVDDLIGVYDFVDVNEPSTFDFDRRNDWY